MNLLEKVRLEARQGSFRPTFLSLLATPGYIGRRGLYKAISGLASGISGRVLDFGCGSKPYEQLFAHTSEYVGVDLEVTGHNHSDSKIDVFYDGEMLPFPDVRFDAVVSFEVFEHVFNLPEIVREINRVTCDSGHLLISIPFAWNEHEVPYDFARYTSFGITHVLKEGGYEVLELRKTTTFLEALGQLFISYLTFLNPRSRFLRNLFQLFVIFPATMTVLILNAALPKRYEYFSNSVILARKVSQPIA